MFQEQVAHTRASLYDIFYASKARKTYTNLGVSLLLILVFLGFALVPTLLTLDDIQDKIDDYKSLNSGLKSKIDAVRSLTRQRNTNSENGGVKNEIDFLEKVMLSDTRINTVYINIYERAKKSNVKVVSITPRYPNTSSSTGVDTYEKRISENNYEVQISVSSTQLSSVIAFINSLEGSENMPIPSRVKTMSIVDQAQVARAQNANSNNTNLEITSEISLIVYLDPTVSNPVQ